MIADSILEIEDWLQDKSIFLNGITGVPCHSDSYMTIVDFTKLNEVLPQSPFKAEDVGAAIEYWTADSNMQPSLKLVGMTWKRLLRKEAS
jgi:hypothetical protein